MRARAGRLAWAAIGAGLFALYLCQSRTAPFNSDGAANVLQGQAIAAGNPLLRGWWTSDVSFYTTELPVYTLVTALRGLSPDVVHVCGALSYTLTVLLAALVARAGAGSGEGGGAGGKTGWFRAGIAIAIMLAPGILGGTEVYLDNPDHAGTAVPVLVLLLLVGTATSQAFTWRGWLRPAAVCALLTVAQVGDGLTLAAATAPLALVSALRLRGPRSAGDGARRQRAVPLDGRLLAAAACSVGLAKVTDLLIRALGGFDRRPLGGVSLAPPGRMPGNVAVLWQSLMLLFGANSPGTPRAAQTIKAHALLVTMADLHAVGLLVAGAGFVVGIAAIVSRRADRVTQVLVAAIITVLAAGVCTTLLRSLSNAHEVAVLLPLAAVLAGRVLPEARWLLSKRLPTATARAARIGATACSARIGALALGSWLVLGAAELCYAATWPAAPSAQQSVADWLVVHHEHAGLAGYWQADAVTVTSGGRVLVAPITLPANAGPAADRWESAANWYQPGQRRATFVIAVTGQAEQAAHAKQGTQVARAKQAALGTQTGLAPAAVRARFGPPAAEHRVGRDVIMLYRYNLLTRLTATIFPGQ